jgi:hypothetical protein
MTLYDFSHNVVAKAAMGNTLARLELVSKAENYFFGPIARFFVGGGGVPIPISIFQNYIFDTHHAFTYYTAVKYGLFT